MTIRVGDTVPAVTLRRLTADGIKTLTTTELLSGKKVALFAVPGAFTPTCSDAHLPGFQVRAEEFKAKGVDTVACVAVNDPFVMAAWAKARGVDDSILMLSDGNGELAEALGLVLDGSGVGLGKRSKRYSALIDDGVVKALHVEPATAVTVSGAETLLADL
jgi:glutaredoxin/glutathione-dependent peroxiredoxin